MSPDNPLASPVYFMAPAETLMESLGPNVDDISCHDLTEAYNAFSNRIKSQIRVILSVPEPQPALVSLQEHSHRIVQALRRDMKRTRQDPAANTSFQSNSSQEEEIRVARDFALLNHHVLCFVSDIFSFPPLYSIFSVDDLGAILNDLLVLGSAESIPSPASCRTWTLIVWILSVQNLPSAIVSSFRREIVSVVKRALEGKMGKDQAKLNGLKASSQFLKLYPSLFSSPLLDVFPCVLHNLISESPSQRLQAAVALGHFARAKLGGISGSCHTSLSAILTTFIDSEMTKSKSLQHQPRLRTFMKTALSADTDAPPAESPFWVVQLLASFVVLLDDSFFSNSRTLKLTLQSLEQVAGHKRHLVADLHPHVWRCLVWVSSRLPVPTDEGEDRVFLTLKQDVRGGIGLALVFSLLGSAPDGGDTTVALSKALVVVGDMLSSGDRIVQVDGMALLTRLLYNPSKGAASVAPQDLLIPQLFDGSLLSPKREAVSATARSLQRLDIGQLRLLSESEINREWDTLADLWARATRISLQDNFDELTLPPPYLTVAKYKQHLLRAWQSLLLMPSDLTQGYGHLTTPAPFPAKIADVICSFIVPVDRTEAQAQQLCLVSRMWNTVTNVFQPSWLASPAEAVLVAVLKQDYNISEEVVRDLWVAFCDKLGSYGVCSATREVLDRAPSVEVKRRLWNTAVESVPKADSPVSWKDLAFLVGVPCRCMFDFDFEAWKELVRVTIENAKVESTTPAAAIEYIFALLGSTEKLSESPKELTILLAYVDLAEETDLPETTIRVIQKALTSLYPEQATKPASLAVIQRTRDIMISAPSGLALPLVLSLQETFCPWLEDANELLDDDVRKEVAQCLYATSLSTIGDIEPSGEILVSISRFLATFADSAAFEPFWKMTYHGRDEFVPLYTEKIKSILRIVDGVWGDNFAADISLDSDSEVDSHAGSSCAESQADYEANMEVDDDDDKSTSTIRRRSRTPVPSSCIEELQQSGSSVSTIHGRKSPVSAKRGTERQDTARKRRRTDDSVGSNAIAGPSRIPAEPMNRTGSIVLSSSQRSSTSKRKGKGRLVLDCVEVAGPSTSQQKKKRRLLLDCVELPTFATFKRRRVAEMSLPTPSPSIRPPPTRDPSPKEEEEDYDSWEAGISMAELQHVRQTTGCDTAHPSSEGYDFPDPSSDDSRQRSHTVPIPPRQHHPQLRRNKTSSRMDALERAYTAITDPDGESQPIHDLVQATRWVHQIGAALNEQIGRKLDKAR
ncbi:hypothetical protein FB45DRAFT_285364 [Roridomyces roridus]|uniref:Telomere-associated protein Rif1 N-terminal domain-containing protein n=1 Tax=Roridomyces roridus TaxID=1738132 RepID=A0AAD7CB07_9AGAR|nr:hypothetical protein FB45DRAFT_285364 [Roridomyces roridus]